MNQSAVQNPIGEELITGRLAHGLPFVLNPRPDFSRTIALLATHYGSLDSKVPGDRGAEHLVDQEPHEARKRSRSRATCSAR